MLKLIRDKLDLSQEELAQRLKMKQAAICRYERGTREFKISPSQLGQLLELLCIAGYSMNEVIQLCKEQEN